MFVVHGSQQGPLGSARIFATRSPQDGAEVAAIGIRHGKAHFVFNYRIS